MAILLVDDSRAMRMIVRRELRKAGYDDVVEAENGAVALALVRGGGVELVVSDWNMPDMNGIELLTGLRSEGNPVAFGFVTSESSDDIRLRALEAGATFVVTKPFTGDDLTRQVDLTLRGGGGGPGSVTSSDVTVATVLQGLLGRKVSISDSPPPQMGQTRAVAEYSTTGQTGSTYCIFEMTLAASVGCALSLVPPAQAEELGKTQALPEAVEANVYEVANVLARLGTPSGGHLVLERVTVVTGSEVIEALRDVDRWWSTFHVNVEGYPSGRLGFTAA